MQHKYQSLTLSNVAFKQGFIYEKREYKEIKAVKCWKNWKKWENDGEICFLLCCD